MAAFPQPAARRPAGRKQPRANQEDDIPWIGETLIKERVERLCARGVIAIDLRGSQYLHAESGESEESTWRRIKGKFGEQLLGRFPLTAVTRPASASPATGSAHAHRIEQQEIVAAAFGDGRTSWY